MSAIDAPEVRWVREYLAQKFPGQSLRPRETTKGKVIFDVIDSHGHPKELRLTPAAVALYSKDQLLQHFQERDLAAELERVPSSVDFIAEHQL